MTHEERIRAAWQGRISGCLLGKHVEMISMREGPQGLNTFLQNSGSLPLRNYVNYMEHELLRGANKRCCLGMMERAEVDDDITYLVLALMMMEQYGLDLSTDDVARSWINLLPVGATFTAERDSYLKFIEKSNMAYQFGGPRSFDLEEINDGEYNDWIELYNNSNQSINLEGYFLSNKANEATKYQFPNISIGSYEYLVLWADEDTLQGDLHLPFKLDSERDDIVLARPDTSTIDYFFHHHAVANLTMARIPNGTGNISVRTSSIGSANEVLTSTSDNKVQEFTIYPNPCNDLFNIKKMNSEIEYYELFDPRGELVKTIYSKGLNTRVKLTDVTSGVYILKSSDGKQKKLIHQNNIGN